MAAPVAQGIDKDLRLEIIQYCVYNADKIREIFQTKKVEDTRSPYFMIENAPHPKYVAILTDSGCCVIQAQEDNGVRNGICLQRDSNVLITEYGEDEIVYNSSAGIDLPTITKVKTAFEVLKCIVERNCI